MLRLLLVRQNFSVTILLIEMLSQFRDSLRVIEMLGTCIGFTDAILVLLLPLLACCLDGRNLADRAEYVIRQHRERVLVALIQPVLNCEVKRVQRMRRLI